MVFFLVVNMLLIGSYLAVAYLENVADSNFPIENLSNHIVLEDGQFVGDGQVTEMLNEANAWAMILDGDGMVVWEENCLKNCRVIIHLWTSPCSAVGISTIIRLIFGTDRIAFW